jgi:hypothetical protein
LTRCSRSIPRPTCSHGSIFFPTRIGRSWGAADPHVVHPEVTVCAATLPELLRADAAGAATCSDLPKRIQYDLYYINNWSLWFDLRILALTITHIFLSRNAY